MIKSFIWPLFNRVVHILLILTFGLTYILGDFDTLLDYHVIFGIFFITLFTYRIIWGFIGPKYSKFKDFNFNIQDLKEYLLHPFSHVKEYIGHNPASSYAIVLIILLSFITILTGLIALGVQENHGVLSFLHNDYFKEMKLFKEIHEISSNLLLGVIGIHVMGALIDRFIKKGDAIDSMIDGHKTLSKFVDIKINFLHKIFIFLSIISFIYLIYYMFDFKNNVFIASKYEKQDYTVLHKDFAKECGSCHIAYPPYLLPKHSWGLIMSGLENHFGDDASIEETTNKSILEFLQSNSAEQSNHKAAFKILKSIEDNSTIAITKTPYWEKKHRKIDKELFVSKEVKSKANCNACHQDIEYGLLERNLIKEMAKGSK